MDGHDSHEGRESESHTGWTAVERGTNGMGVPASLVVGLHGLYAVVFGTYSGTTAIQDCTSICRWLDGLLRRRSPGKRYTYAVYERRIHRCKTRAFGAVFAAAF